MKLNKFTIVGILLLTIFTFGAVNAVDNTTTVDSTVVSDGEDLKIHSSNLNCISKSISSGISDSENGIEFDCAVKNDALTVDEDDVASASSNVPIDVKIINNSNVDIAISNATGNVIVIIDNNETSVPLDFQGYASIFLNNLSVGNHSIVVIYEGDDTHVAAHSVTRFNISDESIVPVSSEFDDIVIDKDLTVSLVLKDECGNVIVNAQVICSVDGNKSIKSTDNNGVIVVSGKNGAVIDVNYEGNDTIGGTYKTIKLNNNNVAPVVKVSSVFNIPDGVMTINGFAVDANAGEEGIYYSTELLDGYGRPIKGVAINFAVNNKIYNRTTNDKGGFEPYKLNMIRAGRYTMAFYFSGNDNYVPSFACVCVDLDKKPITIKAAAKSYKAATKTKKYTATLSTIPSQHDGKVYLSPKKVTLTVNGKTFSGKTNSNGKVTFKITNLNKKGKYTAKISYKGDKTYEEASKKVKLTIK